MELLVCYKITTHQQNHEDIRDHKANVMHLLHKNGKKSSLFNRAKISLFQTQSPYFKTQISLFGPKKISHVWAGLVENEIAKTLRMLADPYKYLENVANVGHPHCRILENALRMLKMLTNAVANNTDVLQTPYE